MRVAGSLSSLVAALKACGAARDLERGRILHCDAAAAGEDSHPVVANTLISMYSKCGSMVDARLAFDKMPQRGIVSWTALMLGYTDNGCGDTALELFEELQSQGYEPNARSFVAALKACSSVAAKEEGRRVDGKLVKASSLQRGMDLHSRASKLGFDRDGFVASSLINLYVKCGSLDESRKVFDRIKHPDKVVLTSLMNGYVENRQEEMALDLFDRIRMQDRDVEEVDAVAFAAAINACGSLAGRQERSLDEDGNLVRWRALDRGRDLHARAARLGFDGDVRVIYMYGKCGSTVDSRRIFDRMPCHSLASWTSLMIGYAENGQGELALKLFDEMESIQPDRLVFVAALKAVTIVAAREPAREAGGIVVKIAALERGRSIHSRAASLRCDSDLFVASRLVDMYAKCGSLDEARRVFDGVPRRDVVLWTSIILGYTDKGLHQPALNLFFRMQDEGFIADTPSFLPALAACAGLAVKESGEKIDGMIVKLGSLEKAMMIHSRAVQARSCSETFMANTLIDLYSKCGCVAIDSRRIFDAMPCHNVVSWTALLLGYAENGEFSLALELFSMMRLDKREWKPGAKTFIAALKSCGTLAAVAPIHADVCCCGMETDEMVANSLMDVYAKVGGLLRSVQIFESLATKEIVAWNTLVAGASRQGDADAAFDLFGTMRDEGCDPDSITFVLLLTACSHAGLVERGKRCFERMSREFGIAPGEDHYTCLIDLLGRANELDAAVEVLKAMPVKPSPMALKSVISSCRKWKNIDAGKLAFELMDNADSAAYSLMANIYGSSSST